MEIGKADRQTRAAQRLVIRNEQTLGGRAATAASDPEQTSSQGDFGEEGRPQIPDISNVDPDQCCQYISRRN